MDDRALAEAMARRDPRALDGAFRRYGSRLYTYCLAMLGDPDTAAGAVHDTFLAAPWDAPDGLRARLYATARRSCRRAGRRRGPMPHAGPDMAQVRELVHAALGGMGARERETVELSVRHGLSVVEVGTVLAVPPDRARALVSQVRARLRWALAVVLVTRTGGRDCAELARLLRGGRDGFSWRVRRHLRHCPACGASMREQLEPALLLPAYAGLPFEPVPAGVWARIQASAAVEQRQRGLPSGRAGTK